MRPVAAVPARLVSCGRGALGGRICSDRREWSRVMRGGGSKSAVKMRLGDRKRVMRESDCCVGVMGDGRDG